MKNIRAIIILGGALSVATWLPAAEKSVTEQFQQALLEEEANRNLPAAIEGYEAVIQRMDEQRQLAATALFRLGESYRKLGKTNDAVRAYERIVSEFKDQETLVKLSEQNLSVLVPRKPEAAGGALYSEEEFTKRYGVKTGGNQAAGIRYYPSPEAERHALELFLSTVRTLDHGSTEQLVAVQTYQNDERLAQLIAEADSTNVKLAELSQEFGADHLSIRSAHAKLKQLDSSIQQQRNAIVAAAEARLQKLQAEWLSSVENTNVSKETTSIPPQMTAEEAEELRRVEALVANSPDLINKRETEGQPPLHRAIQNGHLNVVRYLLAHGADTSATDGNGRTPLYLAAQKGQLSALELLLKAGVSIDQPLSGGQRPLHAATQNGNYAVIEFLIEKGANVNAQDQEGRTSLHVAAEHGLTNAVELLIAGGADLEIPAAMQRESKNFSGNNVNYSYDGTPLNFAIAQLQFASADLLLQKGANPNPETKLVSPLALAVQIGSTNFVHRLIQAGSVTTNEPLVYLALNSMPAEIPFLLDSGADPNLHPANTEPPLLIAVWNFLNRWAAERDARVAVSVESAPTSRPLPPPDVVIVPAPGRGTGGSFQNRLATMRQTDEVDWEVVVKELVEHGADVNATAGNQSVLTLLCQSSGESPIELILWLLEQGADPNVGGDYGANRISFTPPALWSAISADNLELIRLLLEHGVHVDGDNSWGGSSPLHVAASDARLAVVKLLLEHGADVNRKNAEGLTPLNALLKRWLDRSESNTGRVINFNHGPFGKEDRSAGWGEGARAEKEQDVLATIELLLAAGAKLDSELTDGFPAIHFTAVMEDTRILETLLANGVDVNQATSTGVTALHVAASANKPGAMEVLAKAGADLNRGDENGNTPLHYATIAKRVEAAEKLVQLGAKTGAKNGLGATPAEVVSIAPTPFRAQTSGRFVIVTPLNPRKTIEDVLGK